MSGFSKLSLLRAGRLWAVSLAAALALPGLAREPAATEPEGVAPPSLRQTGTTDSGNEDAKVSPEREAARRDKGPLQRLVNGAPLFNPNVQVHTVQAKPFVDQGRLELALYPAVAQINGKFTQHYGSAVSVVHHLQENFGLQLLAQYNWYNQNSAFDRELLSKVREEAVTGSSVLLVWGAEVGAEVTPLYGKFAFYRGFLAELSLVVDGGVGIGGTRHELRPPTAFGPATYGDTGNKLIGTVGAGFRVQLGDRFTFRLEVRDLAYTARVDSVNGCNRSDLLALNNAVNAGSDLASVPVSGSCRSSKFQGGDPLFNVAQAYSIATDETSDVLNNVGLYTGFSVVF